MDYKTDSIKITFNKDMDASTINNDTILLSGVENYSVRYEDKIAYIENFTLFENSEYMIVVSPSIKDVSGFYLKSSYYSRFKTTYDQPSVKSIFPQNQASGVPDNLKSIDIEFSESMNFEGLNKNFFSIEPDVGFDVVIKDDKKLSLALKNTLLSDNTYTVKIGGLITDISGITMGKDFISSFKVSKTPDNNPPSDIVIYSRQIREPESDGRKGFIIEWKAPADNLVNGSLSGKVKAYQIVYSEKPFGSTDFDGKTYLRDVPTPSNPGEIQSITLYSFIDIDNNESEIVYNKPYYFMVRATDGTNFVYSNLLETGILSDTYRLKSGSKFYGSAMKRVENFNGEELIAVGDTDEVYQNLRTGAVILEKMEDGIIKEVNIIYGKSDKSLFGYDIEVLDLNNDGCPDIAVSAPLDGINREGAVYLYFQAKSGGVCKYENSEPVRLSGGKGDSFFGFSVAKINLNGMDNLIVGAPADGNLNQGAFYIYKNNTDINQIPHGGDIKGAGNISGSSLGYSVIAGDLNNDDCEDVIVSAPDASSKSRGEVYVFFSTTGVDGCDFANYNLNNPNIKMSGESD